MPDKFDPLIDIIDYLDLHDFKLGERLEQEIGIPYSCASWGTANCLYANHRWIESCPIAQPNYICPYLKQMYINMLNNKS